MGPMGRSVAVLCPLLAAAAANGQIVLTDATAEAGLLGSHQVHAPGYFSVDEWMMGGLAVGDFDRDGWPDLFVLGGGGVPDQLWMNNRDGTFTNRAAEWGVAALHCGAGVAVGDLDGDGWLDLYVTSYGYSHSNYGQFGQNRHYRNTGKGSFESIAFFSGLRFTSHSSSGVPCGFGACIGDYNLDGRLDLFVACWRPQASGNRLFRNMGDGTFLDHLVPAGLLVPGQWWFQGAFADIDGDGWPELLVAGDFGTSRYFRNRGNGSFEDLTAASGTGLDENGMGQAIADLDGDGRLDWYVTSIFNDPPPPDRLNGNALYLSRSRGPGDHRFVEAGAKRGADDGAWGWAAVAIDLDHDGWVDLVEVNGRGSEPWSGQPGRVFRNLGGGFFEEIAGECGFGAASEGRTMIWWDYDRDGDLDLVVQQHNAPLRLYRNDSPSKGRWLQVTFDTSGHPLMAPDGFGTRVEVFAGGRSWAGVMNGSPSYLGTSELMIHFGLGEVEAIDEVRVRWPRGVEQRLLGVAPDTRLELVAPRLGDLDGDGRVGGSDLALLLAAWGPAETLEGLRGDLDGDGSVGGSDLAILLAAWDPPSR